MSLLTDCKIIIDSPKEHCRQGKIARHQHIMQMLRPLRNSDDLFVDNSSTLAEDKRTSLAKSNTNNKKCSAINSRGTTSIGFAQSGRNITYSLGSAFNRTIKKINRNKHVRFATHNSIHQYNNNE